jgi:hypothetical protein
MLFPSHLSISYTKNPPKSLIRVKNRKKPGCHLKITGF